MKPQKEPVKRLTKSELLANATAQDHSHLHSARIMAKRAIAQFEVGQIESEVAGLTAALTRAKERKAHLEAVIVGFGMVLEKR